MVRLSKAKRGKHRWIGISLNSEINSRKDLEIILNELLENSTWRLFDFAPFSGSFRFIIKVDLKYYKYYLEILNSHDLFETLTSSGKINLVRERLSI
ncbi:MAG: hypothetical protein ACKVI6_05380 [Candidatus Poseidoniales archaeon]|jgi:hypothetical protein|tara:strand:+ start:1576 stop:1866 length:291 start_codon:yes stop_codon:yes gene_type:complete